MKIKYQCFISSTYEDLYEERMSCVNAILDAGHIPAGMEYFKSGRPPREIIHKWIDESDIVILILGGRYGSIDPEKGISYTEDEYRYALQKKKDVFSIVLSDSYLYEKAASYARENKKTSVYEKKNKKLYNAFRKRVLELESDTINFLVEIPHSVLRNIEGIIQRRGSGEGGWVKYNPDEFLDASNINLSSLNRDKKVNILKELIRDKLCETQNEYYDSIRIPDRLISFFNQYENSLKQYLESFSRSIEIVLRDAYIEVTNTTNMSYILAPGEQSEFILNPWMYEGIEAESYQLKTMKYNGKAVDEKYIRKGEMKYAANPFYVYDIINVRFPFDQTAAKHKVYYSTDYRVDYNRFFHEYVFKHFCEYFTMSVNLYDERSTKTVTEYMLKWGMFTPYKDVDYSSKNMLLHKKDRIVFDTSNIMMPGNGYILTLSDAPAGRIKRQDGDRQIHDNNKNS